MACESCYSGSESDGARAHEHWHGSTKQERDACFEKRNDESAVVCSKLRRSDTGGGRHDTELLSGTRPAVNAPRVAVAPPPREPKRPMGRRAPLRRPSSPRTLRGISGLSAGPPPGAPDSNRRDRRRTWPATHPRPPATGGTSRSSWPPKLDRSDPCFSLFFYFHSSLCSVQIARLYRNKITFLFGCSRSVARSARCALIEALVTFSLRRPV